MQSLNPEFALFGSTNECARTDTGLICVKKNMDGRGFPRAGRAAPRDFQRARPKGNPKEQLCQPEENPILHDFSSQIYVLFQIFV